MTDELIADLRLALTRAEREICPDPRTCSRGHTAGEEWVLVDAASKKRILQVCEKVIQQPEFHGQHAVELARTVVELIVAPVVQR